MIRWESKDEHIHFILVNDFAIYLIHQPCFCKADQILSGQIKELAR